MSLINENYLRSNFNFINDYEILDGTELKVKEYSI